MCKCRMMRLLGVFQQAEPISYDTLPIDNENTTLSLSKSINYFRIRCNNS